MKDMKPLTGLLLLIGVLGMFYGASLLFDDPGRIPFRIDYELFIAPSIQVFIDQPFNDAIVNYHAAMNPGYFMFMAEFTKVFGDSFHTLQALNIVMGFLSIACFYIFLIRFGLTPLFALLYSLPIALSPYLKYSALELNTDHFAVVFLVLSLSFLLGAMKRKGKIQFLFLTMCIMSVLVSIYTRQNYLSALIVINILIVKYIHEKAVKLYCIAASILGLIPLMFLFWRWGGFVNPNFQEAHQTIAIGATNIVYGILNGLVYFIPFVIILWFIHRLSFSVFKTPNAASYIVLSVIVIVAFLLTIGFDFSRLHGDGGGLLLKTIKYLPHPYFQLLALFFFILLFLTSSWLVLFIMREKLLYLSFIILLLPLFFNNASYPKYFDPMVVIVLISVMVVMKQDINQKIALLSVVVFTQLFINAVLFFYTGIIKTY